MSPWNLSLRHLLSHLRGCDFSMAGGQSIGSAPLTRLTTDSCITRPGHCAGFSNGGFHFDLLCSARWALPPLHRGGDGGSGGQSCPGSHSVVPSNGLITAPPDPPATAAAGT